MCLLVTDVHKVALFGVFDGHGGKQAAVYASRHLHTHLQNALRHPGIASPADDAPDAAADNSTAGEAAAAAAAADLRSQLQTLGAAPEALASCDGADSVAAALPLALVAAFTATEQAFINHSQVRTRAESPTLALSHPVLTGMCPAIHLYDAAHAKCNTHLQESGTTATVAALVGWSVVVANVGDSLAYLDTGSEVVQVGPSSHEQHTRRCFQIL
jgi:serine/threonine protein phosphatase PrpC